MKRRKKNFKPHKFCYQNIFLGGNSQKLVFRKFSHLPKEFEQARRINNNDNDDDNDHD